MSTRCWLLSGLPILAPTLSCWAPWGTHGSMAVLHLHLFPTGSRRACCAPLGKLRQGKAAAGGSWGWWEWISTGSPGNPGVPLLPFPPGAPALTHLLPRQHSQPRKLCPASNAWGPPAACRLGSAATRPARVGLLYQAGKLHPGLLSTCTEGSREFFLAAPSPLAPALTPAQPCPAQLQAAQYMCPVPAPGVPGHGDGAVPGLFVELEPTQQQCTASFAQP